MKKSLSANGRKQYKQYCASLAKTHGVSVEDVDKQFAVTIPKETKIIAALRESLLPLSRITMRTVSETEGQAITLSGGQTKGKRTNTAGGVRRQPTMLGNPAGSMWKAVDTEYDTGVSYDLIDEWAAEPEFIPTLQSFVSHDISMAKLSVGIYGEEAAATPDPATNPLGEDVNIGWFEIVKDQKPEAHLVEGVEASGEIKIGGTDPDYANVDALVFDMYNQIPVHQRTGNEIVIIGHGLVSYDTAKVISEHAGTPTEKQVIKTVGQSYGGLTAETWPRFPDMGIMVTDPKNLQMLTVEGSTRRHSKDEPEFSRIAEYYSTKEAYAIGNLEAIRTVEAANIVLG